MTASSLYVGKVTHRRLRPARHDLAYRVFMGLFGLDEAPALSRGWAFGFNRPGLISLYEKDHGDGSGAPLKAQVEALLTRHGLEGGGPVRMLCMPRVLGYVFNPLTVYFCHARDGRLTALVHEVNNTFGERHHYVLAVRGDGVIEQACAKAFRVSPFLGMDMDYRFRVEAPGETVAVSILASDAEGPMLTAAFSGRRRPFTAGAILAAWLSHPLLTLKVILGIHWEALFIWLKLKKAQKSSEITPAEVSTTITDRAQPTRM
ncbi:DUF1365 domain-containing protein [Brevundimonas sp. 2R-24]|uniref:DUF1365 domain-containing protein n=1 Tax=Peiella sedimenti TaxID=3061083 RepID=A0ABT8SJQ1_9CAUL|nr:DUF1365 domain-containing protein [Caulobacteraceae bacterium XZ-24]